MFFPPCIYLGPTSKQFDKTRCDITHMCIFDLFTCRSRSQIYSREQTVFKITVQLPPSSLQQPLSHHRMWGVLHCTCVEPGRMERRWQVVTSSLLAQTFQIKLLLFEQSLHEQPERMKEVIPERSQYWICVSSSTRSQTVSSAVRMWWQPLLSAGLWAPACSPDGRVAVINLVTLPSPGLVTFDPCYRVCEAYSRLLLGFF